MVRVSHISKHTRLQHQPIILCACVQITSVVSKSLQSLQSLHGVPLQPHGLQSTRLLCPWDSPGKNTGMEVCPPSGNLPDPEVTPTSLVSPALAVGFFYHYHHPMSYKAAQFWYYLPRDSVRSHRLSALSEETDLYFQCTLQTQVVILVSELSAQNLYIGFVTLPVWLSSSWSFPHPTSLVFHILFN